MLFCEKEVKKHFQEVLNFCLNKEIENLNFEEKLDLEKILDKKFYKCEISPIFLYFDSHLVSILFWSVQGLIFLGEKFEEEILVSKILKLIKNCKKKGFSSHPWHEADILSTLSAIQLIYLLDSKYLDELKSDLQLENYLLTFLEDLRDVRFVNCALASLFLLNFGNFFLIFFKIIRLQKIE